MVARECLNQKNGKSLMKNGDKIKIRAWWLANEVVPATILNVLSSSNFVLVKPDVGPKKMVNKSDVLEAIND